MTEKGMELALWFYQKQQEKLPPRKIANRDHLQIKMPIPFDNMASGSPIQRRKQESSPVSLAKDVTLNRSNSVKSAHQSDKSFERKSLNLDQSQPFFDEGGVVLIKKPKTSLVTKRHQ